jgi:hypothetical protein
MARATCVAALCALTAQAVASPYADPTAGRAVFTGASVPDATSIDLNPAAVGIGSLDEIYLAGMGLLDQIGVHRQTLDLATGALSPGADVSANEPGAGGMFAIVYHLLADRVTIGGEARLTPPALFPEDRPDLRYFSLGGYQRQLAFTLVGAARITGGIYVGVSLSAQRTYLRLRYARDTALAAGDGPGGVTSDCAGAPCGLENPLASERYDIKAHSDWFSATTANLGLAFELARNVWLGVSYHLPLGTTVQTDLAGTAHVWRAPRDGGELVRALSTVYVTPPAGVDAEIRAPLPQQLELHVGMRWQDLSRTSGYDVRIYGAAIPGSGIPEWTERPLGYHDPFAMWAGVEQRDVPQTGLTWRFGGRLGVQTGSVTPARTSPIAIAPLSVTADLGAQLRISPPALRGNSIVLQAMYGLQYFPTVHASPSAFDPRDQLACDASGHDYDSAACTAVRFGYAMATAAGDYDRLEHALRLAVRFEF